MLLVGQEALRVPFRDAIPAFDNREAPLDLSVSQRRLELGGPEVMAYPGKAEPALDHVAYRIVVGHIIVVVDGEVAVVSPMVEDGASDARQLVIVRGQKPAVPTGH